MTGIALPPLSAHLGYLFTDLPLRYRFEAARTAGFDAVEHPSPFDIPAKELADILAGTGLRMAQITSGTGKAGEKGIASLHGREAEFHDSYARALDYAEEIGCPFVHAMAGVGGDLATLRANLERAADLCEGRSPRLLIEAISEAAVPNYTLCHMDDLIALGGAMGPRVNLLVDTFHARADGHDPAMVIRRAGARLGHVHVADFPNRHEPNSGQIDFGAVIGALTDAGYDGAVGFEYIPSGPDHLEWLTRWRAGAV